MTKYNQGRVMFDVYTAASLKSKTRQKRSSKTDPMEFTVSDETQFKVIDNFLSRVNTKRHLTEYLGSALVSRYSDSTYPLLVSYGNNMYSNRACNAYTTLTNHSHEEADTLLALNIKDVAESYP